MWLLKVWSVPTQLPYRSEISQFHTTDHETALSHQPALASAAVRCALLSCLIHSPRIFFFYFKFIDLNRNFRNLHLMYHAFCIACPELLLYSLFPCQAALSVLLYWPALNQRLPRLGVIEQGENERKKKEWTCLLAVLAPSAGCSHILLEQIIKHPAYNLINLFYVCDYYNSVGCLFILFTPTLQSAISSQWHIC